VLEEEMGDKESFLQDKSWLLVEQYGCSPSYARGYVDGEHSRRLGRPLGAHVRARIDEYSLGFRAGYFDGQEVHMSNSHHSICHS
jgi:hypothetical protein